MAFVVSASPGEDGKHAVKQDTKSEQILQALI
jgi:hypothetical protein